MSETKLTFITKHDMISADGGTWTSLFFYPLSETQPMSSGNLTLAPTQPLETVSWLGTFLGIIESLALVVLAAEILRIAGTLVVELNTAVNLIARS